MLLVETSPPVVHRVFVDTNNTLLEADSPVAELMDQKHAIENWLASVIQGDSATRGASLEALRALGATCRVPEAVPELTDTIPTLVDEAVNALQVQQLGRFDDLMHALTLIGVERGTECSSFRKLLRDSRVRVRASAAACIRRIGPEVAWCFEDLVALLYDADESIRRLACELFRPCKLEDISSAVGSSGIARQNDAPEDIQHGEVARRVKRLICSVPLGRAGVELLRNELKNAEPLVRQVAVLVLGWFGRESFEVVAVCLEDADAVVRENACWSLARSGSLAISKLLRGLRDEQMSVRLSALMSLGSMRSEAVEALPGLSDLFDDPNPELRSRAILELAQIQPNFLAPIPKLFELLNDDDHLVRSFAEAALRSRFSCEFPEDAEEARVGVLPYHRDHKVIAWYDNDYFKEIDATIAYFESLSSSSLSVFQRSLNDSRRWVRLMAISCLAMVGPAATALERDIVRLLTALGDNGPELRAIAARTLGRIGGMTPETVSVLEGVLADDSFVVRFECARALSAAQLNERTYIPILIEGLKSDDRVLRYRAVNALGGRARKSDEVLLALSLCLNDPVSQIRSRAESALRSFPR